MLRINAVVVDHSHFLLKMEEKPADMVQYGEVLSFLRHC